MLITEGSLQSLMWLSPLEALIAKGSIQSLVRLSTTRILSNYMTLFFVQKPMKELGIAMNFQKPRL
jgi:hypothetical protein